MRVVLQRVSEASVVIEGSVHGKIDRGLLVLVGVTNGDTQQDIDWLVQKIIGMRIFSDDDGKMNDSLMDVQGEILVVSQFTLYANTKKCNRPSYIEAARPEIAVPIYEAFLNSLSRKLGKNVPSGKFGADMKIQLVNDGPVSIVMDSKNR